jgi:hypothetical protein
VSGIKEAVTIIIIITIIAISITVACCLHAGQSFLHFWGGYVEDALTCNVRGMVGWMKQTLGSNSQSQLQALEHGNERNARKVQHENGRLTIRILDVEDGQPPLSNKSTNDFNVTLGNT